MTKTAFLTAKLFFGAGFDVIHACNPPDLFCLIAAPYRLLGRRFVFDQHDLTPEIFKVQFEGRLNWVYGLLRLFEKATYRLANAVIATNESMRGFARARGPVPLRIERDESMPGVASISQSSRRTHGGAEFSAPLESSFRISGTSRAARAA